MTINIENSRMTVSGEIISCYVEYDEDKVSKASTRGVSCVFQKAIYSATDLQNFYSLI